MVKTFSFSFFLSILLKNFVCPPPPPHIPSNCPLCVFTVKADKKIPYSCITQFAKKIMCLLKNVCPFFGHFKNCHIVQLQENLIGLKGNRLISFSNV